MSGAPLTPTRPVLRWYGSKWRIAPWIIGHFPSHDAYCEPYGGSASVLLRKPQAKIETWNDLHGRLVNLFRVLRERPDELLAALEVTPYARAEHDQAREPHPDPVEDARRFYVLAWQGRNGGTSGTRATGWRYILDIEARRGHAPPDDFADLANLRAAIARFRHVQIEHAPALTVLGRYDRPEVLHYVDPPYWDPAADLRGWYAHAMTERDHRDLAEALHQVVGMVVLSGRPSELYDELYGAWHRIDRQALNDAGEMGAESLWLSPAAAAAQPQGRLAL